MYLVSVAFGANESPAALPSRLSALQSKHAPVVAFLAIVCLNAVLFSVVWMWREQEERTRSGEEQRRSAQVGNLLKRLKLAEEKIANDKRVADAAKKNSECPELALD